MIRRSARSLLWPRFDIFLVEAPTLFSSALDPNDFPIALRKGKHTCTQHPIVHFGWNDCDSETLVLLFLSSLLCSTDKNNKNKKLNVCLCARALMCVCVREREREEQKNEVQIQGYAPSKCLCHITLEFYVNLMRCGLYTPRYFVTPLFGWALPITMLTCA